MSVFKDSEGREWLLEIGFREAIRIKKFTGFNLNDVLTDFTVIAKVASDPEQFFSIVVVLLKQQLQEEGITEDEFAGSINDFGVVEEMQRAFVEAVIDFFPKDRRAILKRAFESFRSAMEAKAAAGIEELAKVDFAAMATSSLSAGRSPGSLEASTIESSPSENSST